MSAPAVTPGFYGRHQGLAKRLIRPWFRWLWSIEVAGLENVPRLGPAVLCPNHLAAIDSFVVPSVLDRPVIYVGKAEYLDSWKTRWLFPALGMIPLDRRGGEHAQAALDAARAVLEDGGLFAIYPEGTRSRTGQLHRGKTGAARLAIETGAPIIPVGLIGTNDIQPIGSSRPRFFQKASVQFGSPISVERYRTRIGDHALYRELIDEVMFEIQAMTGQEYVDRYAGDPAGGATTIQSGRGTAGVPAPAMTVPLPSAMDLMAGGRRSSAEALVSRPLPARVA
jgi:1-acyl-sn-glycerol-3-phosphate acyltransferase